MRVTIEPISEISSVKHGFFSSKTITEHGNFLKIEFEFTDEELDVLNKYQLWNDVLFETPNLNYRRELQIYQQLWADYEQDAKSGIEVVRWTAKPPKGPEPSKMTKVTIEAFCTPRTERFSTPAEAKNYASDMQHKHLPKLKEIIQYNKTPAKKQTFEL